MNLSEIFCQTKAVSTLQQAFAGGKLAHAYIFEGIEGVGKYTTALAFAKLLLCKSPIKSNSCGKCPSCTALDADSHPDFHHVYKELIRYTKEQKNRDKTPTELPIDVIREFVIEKVQLKPVFSSNKVFIISEAEKLNAASQNALLKTLEEPPDKSFIILLCTKLDNLLPTTRSRCQIVHFGPLNEEKIIERLCSSGVDKSEANFWARLFGGSMGQAELFSGFEPSFYKIKKELLNRFSKFELADAVDFAQWINSTAAELAAGRLKLKPDLNKSDINRQIRKVFVWIFVSAFNDAMKFSFAEAEKMTNFDQPGQIKLIAQKYQPEDCARMIDCCYETIRFIDAPVNEKLVFEHLLLNCTDSGIIQV